MSKVCTHHKQHEMTVHLYAGEIEVSEAVAEIVNRYGEHGALEAVYMGDTQWGAEYVFTGTFLALHSYMDTFCGMEEEEFEAWDIRCLTCTPKVAQ